MRRRYQRIWGLKVESKKRTQKGDICLLRGKSVGGEKFLHRGELQNRTFRKARGGGGETASGEIF